MTMACTSFAAEAVAHVLQKNVMIEDVTANAHHGVYVGDFTSRTDGAYMDGTLGQFGVIPDHADLRITTTSGVFSIEFWIRSSSFASEGGTGQRFICKNEDASNQWAVTVTDDIANGGGRLTMGVDYGGVTYSVTGNVGNNVIPYNTLAHCVITMNATTPLLYVNGNLVTTGGSLPGLGAGANFLLGRLAQGSTTGRFTGILRRIAYYPDVLTPIEILTHYAAGDIPNINMIVRSQEFDHASWIKVRSSVTANSTTAPNGSTTADTLVEDASPAVTHYCFNSNVVAANSTVFTYSVYAKTKERSQIRLYVQEGASGADFFWAIFDVTLGTVLSSGNGGTGAFHSATITAAAQGFYRCSITGIYGTTGTTLDSIIHLASGGFTTYSGNGTSGIYLWGAQLEENDAVHRYIPTVAAAVTILSYNATILLDTPEALWPLEEVSTAQLDSWQRRPIAIDVNNECWLDYSRIDTLSIEDTLGEQMSCQFQIVNPTTLPVIGDQVRVRYYDEVLFAGTIDQLKRTTNNTLTERVFDCTCTDWSQILIRNIIERNFLDLPIANIVGSLLDNELAGEGLTLGSIDQHGSIPILDSDAGTAFEVLRTAAQVTGQTFYVDHLKRIQMRSTTNESSPSLTSATVETAYLSEDREKYRNVQRVKCTGSIPEGGSGEELSMIAERTNEEQIAARAAIEGGSGRYENYQTVTHPISNDPVELMLMAIGYANLSLSVSGTPRSTLSCRVRGYGFRAGQFATVDLPTIGASGTWLIQRVSIREESGRRLIHTLELALSSAQLRAYEAWLKIVEGGKVVAVIPSAITNNFQTFNTPGADTWTVPAGVTIAQFTCIGASGGGAGVVARWYLYRHNCQWTYHPTAIGYPSGSGSSGRAMSIVNVTEGQVFDLVVGSAGIAGANGHDGCSSSPAPASGGDGTTSSVSLSGVVKCQGNGAGGGNIYTDSLGAPGGDGSGIGDAITVGGGFEGGIAGVINLFGSGPVYGFIVVPTAGVNGRIDVAW